MTQGPIATVVDPAELARVFGARPEVHLYGLADLEEPYWSASRWWRRRDAVVGVVGLPDADPVVYAITARAPAATLALLDELARRRPGALPARGLVVGPPGSAAVLARHRRGVRSLGAHRRCVLGPAPRLAPGDDGEGLRALEASTVDLELLAELHADDPGAAFITPTQVASGCAVGVVDPATGALLAAAGTHVLSERYGVAAVGGVLARRSHRGRGLGRRVTAAVCRRLVDRVAVIGLNVHVDNLPAQRVYEQLGFVPAFDYEEATLSPA